VSRTPILGFRRRNALILFSSLVLLVWSHGFAADGPQATHYSLRVNIVPAEERMAGTAQITISNTSATRLREIHFLLYRLLAVEAAEDEHGAPLPYHQAVVSMSDEKNWQVNSVSVRLRQPLAAGSIAKITLKYSGAIFGYREVMGYVRDHIGEDYALLRQDALAYPILADASFRSLMATIDTRFDYDLEITVPKGMVVACGGVLRGTSAENSTQTFRFVSGLPTWRIDIAAANFKVLKNSAGNLVVYVLADDESRASNLLAEMERVTAFYTRRFGPSEKAKAYTVIETPEGYGSQAGDGYITLQANALKDPEGIHQIYHEIGHAWNAQVKPELQRVRWFDEAFASYFAALAVREFNGQKAFDDEMLRYREHFRHDAKRDARNATTPIADYGKLEIGENSYTKGAWSLFVLEEIVGEEQFNQIIRTLLSEFSARPADFKDFQNVVARVSKRDLSRFFSEWIYGVESSQLLMGDASIQEIVQRYREKAGG
jgi:hypothetical protein